MAFILATLGALIIMSRAREGSIGSSSRTRHSVDEDEDNVLDIPTGVEIGAWRGESGDSSQDMGLGINSADGLYGVKVNETFLLGKNHPSKFTNINQMYNLRILYNIPKWVSLHAPGTALRADHSVAGWVCMYEKTFKEGLRLPLPRLVLEFLHYYHISPGQLMPNVWRVLMGMQAFGELKGFEVDLEDVLSTYTVQENNTERGRYQLSRGKKLPELVCGVTDSGSAWKHKYFFMNYDALGDLTGYDIPSAWCNARRLTVPWPVSNRNLEKRRARFTIFPSDKRHWSVILGEESLRQTTLWSSVPPGPEDYVMSHPKMNLLPEKDSYETYLKMREKKKASGRGKKGGSGSEPVSESDVQVVEPSGRSKRKKKAAPFEVPDYSDGSIHLTLPSGTSAQTDYDSCADHFERLLLEDDRTRMLKVGVVDSASTAARLAFQGYQYTLFMKEQLVEAADQLKVALREQDALRKELEEEKGRYETAEKELRDELSLKSHLISALQSQIGQLEATLKVREEELQFSHLQTVVLTRGEMMKEFKEGKAGSWNVEKGIREMEDVLRDRAEGVGVVDATTDGEGDGSED
ncbi:uncharacterized protein LOC130992262 isoform X2 [Salvia miltiorrhiza]|uniref:uncharacterized protein LOC130992262 isoform X2 n=1 Tax=Salvia miltiorrhiza TaxID=226208 RepID=UPI0025AC8DD2|nr:uncharacterized protein LOC130992262 isoform X2 [Salvia miltiorrhiza]